MVYVLSVTEGGVDGDYVFTNVYLFKNFNDGKKAAENIIKEKNINVEEAHETIENNDERYYAAYNDDVLFSLELYSAGVYENYEEWYNIRNDIK